MRGAAHGSRRGRDPHKAAKPTGCEPFSAGAEQTTPRAFTSQTTNDEAPAFAAKYTRSLSPQSRRRRLRTRSIRWPRRHRLSSASSQSARRKRREAQRSTPTRIVPRATRRTPDRTAATSRTNHVGCARASGVRTSLPVVLCADAVFKRLLRASLSSSRRLVMACCVRRGRLEMSEMLRRFCGDVICDPLRKGHTAQFRSSGR